MKNNEWSIIKEMIKEKVSVADWAFLSNDAMVWMDDFDGKNVVILTANSFVSNVLDKPDIIRAIKEYSDRYYGKDVYVSIREAKVEEVGEPKKRTEPPRMCEILGVSIGERFRFKQLNGSIETFSVNSSGMILSETTGKIANYFDTFDMINHPDRIIKNKLTEKEHRICEAIGAKWVTKSKSDVYVTLWDCKPTEEDGIYLTSNGQWCLATAYENVFPSVKNGDCIYVGE